MCKKIISYSLLIFVIPAIILLGAMFFKDKMYSWITLCVALVACIPFFLSFEKGKSSTKEMIVVAVMVAIAVVGRILCAPLPGFKPVTAVIVITAMYFGGEIGFMTGALSAVISNFYFGQGPWTPFQMFVWGLIGLVAGILSSPLKRNKVILIIYGIFSGIAFSLLMDVWSMLWWDGTFNLSRYLALVASSLPFLCIYAVSNVVFLLILSGTVGKKLNRIKTKYGI